MASSKPISHYFLNHLIFIDGDLSLFIFGRREKSWFIQRFNQIKSNGTQCNLCNHKTLSPQSICQSVYFNKFFGIFMKNTWYSNMKLLAVFRKKNPHSAIYTNIFQLIEFQLFYLAVMVIQILKKKSHIHFQRECIRCNYINKWVYWYDFINTKALHHSKYNWNKNSHVKYCFFKFEIMLQNDNSLSVGIAEYLVYLVKVTKNLIIFIITF